MANSGSSKSKSRFKALISTPIFRASYLAFALVVAIGTTIYWALLGAKLQQGNADQLVDNQLLKTMASFRGATFPGAHTQLIKWPLFWLVNLFGSTSAAIETFTVLVVLVTVGVLLGILYKIDKRPIVFGTVCLALSSVLLLVPATPYAGALLPVNMAMLTTRNLEYIFFIGSLILLVRSPVVKSWGFWLSAVALSILAASDKLFLALTLAGAAIALVIYIKKRNAQLASFAVNLMIVGALAVAGSYIILEVITKSRLTHLTSAGAATPYALTHSTKNFALGIIYGALGVLTNFGANPAFAATEVKNIPSQFFSHLFSFAGPAYIVNVAILIVGLFAIGGILRLSWRETTFRRKPILDNSQMLSWALIWVSLAAILSFIFSNHYYAVDARYLTIILFTVFISFAAYSRRKKWRPEVLVVAGLIICASIIFALIGATQHYNSDQAALASQNDRNSNISQILKAHQSNILVGDYWRVIPIKQISGNNLTVTPLEGCTQPQTALTSTKWQPSLHGKMFVYLLSINGNLTNYPNCTLNQVVKAYGRPNSSSLIAGKLTNPSELLLFYDRGIHNSAPKTPEPATGPATVLPIPLSSLPYTTCQVPGVMNIVAHEDDDLLFMNPDIINYIKEGYCVRTVYVTAGNAGAGQYYWIGREEGVEAAYSEMLGSKSIWIQRIVQLAPNEFITVANPKGNAKISLIFMHLPDGNLKGQGFSISNFESLQKLMSHQINTINSIDNQSYYSSDQLVAAISTLMNVYSPGIINTQSSNAGGRFTDHSDHLAVSWFVKQAYSQFEAKKYNNLVTIPINYYLGYPGRDNPANVSGQPLQEKEAAFEAYTKYDGATCQTLQICLQTPTYNGYLSRQYLSPY